MTLLELIDRFQRATRLSDSTLSQRAGCYSKQIARMREGRVPRDNIDQRLRTYINGEVARFHREFPQ